MAGPARQYFGWAENAAGEMVHVNEVSRGLACNCVCVKCHKPLIARQGESRIWHFSHGADAACDGESALHRAAKVVLVEAAARQRTIRLPSKVSRTLEAVMIETGVGKRRRADAVVTAGSRNYGVEIRVTHGKDQAARDDYERADLEAFEIDLRHIERNVNRHELTEAVLIQANRLWLYKRGMGHVPTPGAVAHLNIAKPHRLSYEQIVDRVCVYLTSPAGQANLTLPWPVIRVAGLSPLESTPDEWRHGRVIPKLYRIERSGEWVTQHDKGTPILRTRGRVATPDGTAGVDVIVQFDTAMPEQVGRPTLFITCPTYLVEPDWPGMLFMSWRGIEAWHAKLAANYARAKG